MNYFIQWLLRLIRHDMEGFEKEIQTDQVLCKAVKEKVKEENAKERRGE